MFNMRDGSAVGDAWRECVPGFFYDDKEKCCFFVHIRTHARISDQAGARMHERAHAKTHRSHIK